MKIKFNGIFQKDMYLYMKVRIASVCKNTYRADCYHLMSLDHYLCEREFTEEIIQEEMINDWLASYSIPQASLEAYIKTVRGFMGFRKEKGNRIYLPHYRKKADNYIPYIFTDNEMEQILESADSMAVIMPNLILPYIYAEIPMIIRLLYCCGLRLGEALQIRIQDIDLELGVLIIRHAKREKQRFVPLQQSLQNILMKYCMALGVIGKPDAYIFPGKTFDFPISDLTVERKFKRILQTIGIISGSENPHERGPCLHCLRHYFMLKSFQQLIKDGYTVDEASPYLSIYCGHESLRESEKYMKFSSEMFPDDMACFESFTEDIFPEVVL